VTTSIESLLRARLDPIGGSPSSRMRGDVDISENWLDKLTSFRPDAVLAPIMRLVTAHNGAPRN
jgi:hypothetical protein